MENDRSSSGSEERKSQLNPICILTPYSGYLKLILIISFHLHANIPSCIFQTGFQTNLFSFFIVCMRAKSLAHLVSTRTRHIPNTVPRPDRCTAYLITRQLETYINVFISDQFVAHVGLHAILTC